MNHFSLYPLSESAITLQYGEEIAINRHRELLQLMQQIQDDPFPGFREVSIAFHTVTIFFDPYTVFENVKQSPISYISDWLNKKASWLGNDIPDAKASATITIASREQLIPVCYEEPFAFDLDTLAAYHGIDPETVISMHTNQSFYVFMVGFTPGFPYMGILPPALDTPRKATPSLMVPAGSVGIAGQQTGIYPFTSPGGWNIIGRTPIKLFDINDNDPCLLKAGDRVRFSRIDRNTFNYLNQYEDS